MTERLIEIRRMSNGSIEAYTLTAMDDLMCEENLGTILADALRLLAQAYDYDPMTVLSHLDREVRTPTTEIFRRDPETGGAILKSV